MISLESAQRELYLHMRELGAASFFLKKSRKKDELWVSDVLLRQPDFPVDGLRNLAYACTAKDHLLTIGFTLEEWRVRLRDAPARNLPFPKQEEDLEPYALVRLFLYHSEDRGEALSAGEELSLLNEIYRLTAEEKEKNGPAVKNCFSRCALWLRQGKRLSEDACRLLCWHLTKEENS